MQLATDLTSSISVGEIEDKESRGHQSSVSYPHHKVIRRNGTVVNFDPSKIALALTKAFLAVSGGQGAASAKIRELVSSLTETVVHALPGRHPEGGTFHIEDIQDMVELALMRTEQHEVARAYVLYRERRNKERAERKREKEPNEQLDIKVRGDSGLRVLDIGVLRALIDECCDGLGNTVDQESILKLTLRDLYDGVSIEEVNKSIIMASRSLIEKEPNYSFVTARLLLNSIRKEVLGKGCSHAEMHELYKDYFPKFIAMAVEKNLLDKKLLNFDLHKLGEALDADKDMNFGYLGLQTLYDRYFLHSSNKRIELPQVFFMRVAMGLAINESEREARAIEFYRVLSSFEFMSSTPTLFNSGTIRSQLSSCYLTTISDDLDGIYEGIKENALLSKFAGGLGNDWSAVRALGSHIKGTNGKSQGVVPFLKVVNDTAVAVNQGGKRKGAVCAYLETWHLDVEEFLELRKNTGDDRRRTHDMNTANWIPDLFMKRVHHKDDWTLFSPADVPDLHDLYGEKFNQAYIEYEKKAERGEISLFKKVKAAELWRKMLSMLFETGHPWITFKDPCNIRSPQSHVGVVHSSNLCTEITLNTSDTEIAVCNLGSVNLTAHLSNGELDLEKMRRTISTAMRMLDNVVDINFYAVDKARNSNLKHRPVGLGMMGFQDCLHIMNVPYASSRAVEFADNVTESLCYYAYWASTELSEERGRYSTFDGSLWSQGILPQDTVELLRKERGGDVELDMSSSMDWSALRERIQRYGIRNSNCVAIAPTATIANIVGVSASIEPTFQNLYVKSNLSGEFTVTNKYLVNELKKLNLWDDVMISDLKYFDGSLAKIDRVPAAIRELYSTAFEMGSTWLVECAARRQKWIDQAQSLNIYMAGASGKKLDEIYKLAWKRGLKTTYYLRTLGATHVEKATVNSGSLNAVPTHSSNTQNSSELSKEGGEQVCSIYDPECEACQ